MNNIHLLLREIVRKAIDFDRFAFVPIRKGGNYMRYRKGLPKMKLRLIGVLFLVPLFWTGCSDTGGNESSSFPDKPTLSDYYEPFTDSVEPNAPGYELPLDLGTIQNYEDISQQFGLGALDETISEHGFGVMEFDLEPYVDGAYDNDDMVLPYEVLLNRFNVPIVVTADTLLHLYHIQFDETLKAAEENEFIPDIKNLTTSLLEDALCRYYEFDGDLQEAARRNVAYLAVASLLIDPGAAIPEFIADLVQEELALIETHEGFSPSPIFIYQEDYSQYVPRGHYTRSEALKRYFQTMMWYGRMAFLLKGHENWGIYGEALISPYDARIQTMQAVMLSVSINTVESGGSSGRSIWDRIYVITCFYVGLADDLTPYDYLWALNHVFGNDFTLTDLLDDDKFYDLRVELSLLPSPRIYGGTGNPGVSPPISPETLAELLDKTKGMRFMGQRFIPDSYIFQMLTFPSIEDYTGTGNPVPFTFGATGVRNSRCYPRGLDVMSLLGSDRAQEILVYEGDTEYLNYDSRMSDLRNEFGSFTIYEWNRNLYWSWLYSLKALIGQFPQGYPNFMRTAAWEHKELNSVLTSWTELRHDTILYAKPSYTPWEYGTNSFHGYVEPVPEFFGRLMALTRMTRVGLKEYNALSPVGEERLLNLEYMLNTLIDLSHKELTNEKFSDEDEYYLANFATELEKVVLDVEGQSCKTTLVADVHTHTYEEMVVEEGSGYVDLIFVAYQIPDGSIFLGVGPVLSYYEFKQPMGTRLTDEAWRDMLASPDRPDRPPWFQYLVHK